MNTKQKKIQDNYITSVREVLAELAVHDEDEDYYILSCDKKTYDRFLKASDKALKAGCEPL